MNSTEIFPAFQTMETFASSVEEPTTASHQGPMRSGALDVKKNSESATASEQINSQTPMDFLMSFQREFHANLLPLLEKGVAVKTFDGSGRKSYELSENFSRDSQSSRTQQPCGLLKKEKPLEESSEPLPKSGMFVGGMFYQLQPLVQGIGVQGSSWLLPTPIARDWKDTPGMAKSAGKRVRLDTLPRKIYYLEESPPKSGTVNPVLSQWLMGYPAGWLSSNPPRLGTQ